MDFEHNPVLFTRITHWVERKLLKTVMGVSDECFGREVKAVAGNVQ